MFNSRTGGPLPSPAFDMPAARVNVQPAQLGLVGTYVGRRADKLLEGSMDGLVSEAALRGFRDSEINHPGHGHAIVQRDEDV